MLWRVSGYHRLFSSHSCVSRNLIQLIINMPFYAVAKGRTAGIFMNWADCEAQVKGHAGARYKKFNTATEAQDFIEANSDKVHLKKPSQKPNRSNLPSTKDLKRSYSSSAQNKKNDAIPKKKVKSKRKSSQSTSEDSDDISTVIVKQLDDIEKRLNKSKNSFEKLVKKGPVPGRTILIEPQKNENNNFKTDNDGFVHVYTDGACTSNGRQGARAGLGVYWGDGHSLNVSEPVSGRATNNCGEIQAATKAIKQALDNGIQKLAINTDSKFLINSVTKWIPGWKRKGWKLKSGEPVKNETDFKELDSIQNSLEIKWNYVEAHKGIHGNEIADQLAKAGAAMYNK